MIVIITSVVEPTHHPLSYSPVRSVYSPEQRFAQTIETIASVRRHLPHAHICLVECSPPDHKTETLASCVDHFINVFPDDLIRHGAHKALGEAKLVLAGIQYAKQVGFDSVMKLTGRYVLTESFKSELWHGDRIQACVTNHYGGQSVHTFIYRCPFKKIGHLEHLLNWMLDTVDTECVERRMWDQLGNEIDHVPHLGVLARWSSYGHETRYE